MHVNLRMKCVLENPLCVNLLEKWVRLRIKWSLGTSLYVNLRIKWPWENGFWEDARGWVGMLALGEGGVEITPRGVEIIALGASGTT